MAIRIPGYRPLHQRFHHADTKRSVVAILSLTAMVDMFTVLTVFLLQNYNPDTGAVLDIPAEVQLPQASKHKEVKPSHVITITNDYISFNKELLFQISEVQNDELLLGSLRDRLASAIQRKKAERDRDLGQKLQSAIDEAKSRKVKEDESYRKVTIQADRGVDFLVIKKVMHTASEAGAGEINFAVLLKDPAQS